MPKLTKMAIDTLPIPSGEQSFAWDSEVNGFGVRVS